MTTKFAVSRACMAMAATLLCSQAVLPTMISQRWGHIINMSPPVDVEMAPGRIAYTISKLGPASGGAHEFSLVYSWPTRNPRKPPKDKLIIPCPDF